MCVCSHCRWNPPANYDRCFTSRPSHPYAWRFSGQWDVQRHPNFCTHHFSQNPPSWYGHDLWTADSFNGFSFVIACIVIQCKRTASRIEFGLGGGAPGRLVNCVWMVCNGLWAYFCVHSPGEPESVSRFPPLFSPPSLLPSSSSCSLAGAMIKKIKKIAHVLHCLLVSSSTFFPPLQFSLSPLL